MGCHIQISKHKGVHFNRGCTTAVLVLSFFYLFISLAYTLTTRLYLRAYYNSAHVAGLSVFVAVFIISHHLFRNHSALNCTIRSYAGVQIVWSFWALLGCAATSIAYTMLSVAGNLNFDYVAAFVFGYVDVILLLYLFIVSCAGVCGSLSDHQYDFTYRGRNVNVYTVGNDYSSSKGSSSSIESSKPCCTRALRCCCATLYGFIYFLFHIIFALVIFLTAYHPATTLHNLYTIQNSSDMYTVDVEGHRSLSLFLRCRGNGTETIVYENGLGGLAMMEWDFIPKVLEDRYKVCIHDRRGYGWSEGYEWDYIQSEPQWAENNAKFFQALIRKADIQTPFYYIGHSYGGTHLAYNAFLYPETVKGLVFLDTASLSPVESLKSYMEIINNFRSLGLLKIALDTGLLDYKSTFGEVVNFDYLTNETTENVLSSIATGYYFSAFQTERDIFNKEVKDSSYSSYPTEQLSLMMKDGMITKPVLVIDADYKGGFAEEKFSQYRDYYHYGVPGADHQTLVYDFPYVQTVSDLIDSFIEMQEGAIDNATFVAFAQRATNRDVFEDTVTQV